MWSNNQDRGKEKNVILFEQNIKNLFIGIFNFSKIKRDDYNQIIANLESFEQVFKEEIINNEFSKKIEIDFTKIREICNQINLNDNLNEFIGNIICLTHNYSNNKLNINFMITSNLIKEEELVRTFMDAHFSNYKSWYRPSKESIISMNIKVFSHILQNFILLIEKFTNWFFNYIKNVFIKFSQKHNIKESDLLNLLNGFKLLCKNMNLLKLGFHESIEYNLTIIFVNLIENICRIISNDDKLNLNSLLCKIKKDKMLNDDLVEIIKFFLLSIYIEENNMSYGYDIRNKIMHGFFDSKYYNPYEVGFLFISLVNEINLKNEENIDELLIKRKKDITND